MFDWIKSDVDTCAWHIATIPSSNTCSQIEFHTRMGNTDVVEKIIQARKLAKKYRVLLKADQIKRELQEGN